MGALECTEVVVVVVVVAWIWMDKVDEGGPGKISASSFIALKVLLDSSL